MDVAEKGQGCQNAPTAIMNMNTYPGNPSFEVPPNCFHASSSTNLHFHGTHVSPSGISDNVLLNIRPSPRDAAGNPTVNEKNVKPIFDQIFAACAHGHQPLLWSQWPPEWQKWQEELLKTYDKTAPYQGGYGLPPDHQLWLQNQKQMAEKRLPQVGRIKIRIENNEVDIRVSVIPMLHGEAVVMRLLRQSATLRGMGELGMDSRELKSFRHVLGLPHGIILVTGPTGSGKTSTLYTALNEINDSVRKIITIEDPIEYQLRGVNQIQVSEKAGLTFARGLRSILRHDPDVILVGEIRDQETAQIAVQASLTGHLVFSTLHTNDAPGALTRLVDMGVEPYLVASSLEAVLAQRLVRVLCPQCKKEDTSPATQALKVELQFPSSVSIYGAVGCRECRQTGYHGRRAIFEWMDSNNEIRQMILKNCSSDQLAAAARRAGMRSLADDGWRLVGLGVTTPAEVLRVTKDQSLSSGGEESAEPIVAAGSA